MASVPLVPLVPSVPSVPSAQGATVKDKIPFDWNYIQETFKTVVLLPFDKAVIQTLPEIGHLAPVIIMLGTAFVSLVTLNYPLAVFAASSAEAFGLYTVIQMITGYAITPDGARNTGLPKECKSFFQSLTPSRFDFFMKEGLRREFPNYPLYFISFAVAYCIQSMYFYSEECSELGPQYSNRPYLAIIAAGMFISLYSVYTLAYKCDSVLSVLFTIVIGLVIGNLISNQNKLLLGKQSVDLMFIPTLGRRSGMDYICVNTNTAPLTATIAQVDKSFTIISQAVPNALSYKIEIYSNTTLANTGGTLVKSYPSVSSTQFTTPLNDITLAKGKYYYATITGIKSDKSTSAPITTPAIQAS
jgi:hypothetical protein